MKTQMYPLLFDPVYKSYLWGGGRIATLFDRAPQQARIAESWEIADRPEGMSVVRNGPLAGSSLHDQVTGLKAQLLGSATSAAVFPLLVKIIDAQQRLSLQVHPDDRAAEKHGGQAKTEMWYVLHADPGAGVFVGTVSGVDAKAFQQALKEKRSEAVLRRIPVQAGEAIYVPGGCVHAIDQGCVLLEVQQNSNTTYRVDDWGRVDQDGQPRALHVAEALRVMRWPATPEEPKVAARPLPGRGPNSRWEILKCPYFVMTRMTLREREQVTNSGRSFHALFVAAGSVRVEGGGAGASLGRGTSCLLPAGLEQYSLTPEDGEAAVLRISLP